MKYLSVILKCFKAVAEFFIGVVLVVFVFLPMALLEGIDSLTTSKEDKKFIKDFYARQKELDNTDYRISFFPKKEMDSGVFSYIEKIKGRDNAEKTLECFIEPYNENNDEDLKDPVFLWGLNEEKKLIIDSMSIRKIQNESK